MTMPVWVLIALVSGIIVIGLVRLGYLRLSIRWSMFLLRSKSPKIGLFRNSPHVVPGRWGFYVLGFEVGSRNPGDAVGKLLKRCWLWPW